MTKIASVIYGDAEVAECHKKMIYDYDGNTGWLMMIKPNKRLIERYGLRLGLNMLKGGFVYRWYAKESVYFNSELGRIIVEVGFDGEPTFFSMRTEDLKTILSTERQANRVHKGLLAYQSNEMNNLFTYPGMYWRRVVTLQNNIMNEKRKTEEMQNEIVEQEPIQEEQ